MKKSLLTIIIGVLTVNAFGQHTANSKLTVSADLRQLSEIPKTIIISHTGLGGYETTMDTGIIAGKRFNYTINSIEPEFFKINVVWENGKNILTSFWVDPASSELQLDTNFKPILSHHTGKSFSDDISNIEKQIKAYHARSDNLIKKLDYRNKKVSDVEKRINQIRDSIDLAIDEHIYKKNFFAYLDSPIALYLLCKYAERPFEAQRKTVIPAEMEDLLSRLPLQIRELPSAKTLARKLKLSKHLQVGNTMQDIALLDSAGNSTKLSNFRGKYLLIEFWASWCAPCREENPALIQLYNKYKNKGFEISGITLDNVEGRISWLRAIQHDKVGIWPQLSDFEKDAQKKYDIRLVPANFLLDPQGVIIAKNLRGHDLEKFLSEIFDE